MQYSGRTIQILRLHEGPCTCRTQDGLYKLGGFSGIMAWHEETSGLGMDALVTVCSWNTNGSMVWAWMLW